MRFWLFVSLLMVRFAFGLDVRVSAQAAILINADTGAVLFEKQAHLPMYPASITKVITALYALEKKGDGLDEMVVADADSLLIVPPHVRRASPSQHPPYRLEQRGTSMGLQVGEELPFRCLLYGLMLESGNDAANVIARHVSGSIDQFMAEMNEFVQKLGCRNTRLFAPHGLPHPEHVVSAYDMAMVTRRALQHSEFREVVQTVRYLRPGTQVQPPREMNQFNALIKPGPFYYPKAIGVKTGYTTASGYTLVGAAEDQHRRLIAVVLGCERNEDRYRDAIALFEAAFQEAPKTRVLFSHGFDRFSCPIRGGKSALEAQLAQDFSLAYYASEEPQIETVVHWYGCDLPVRAGQTVGEVVAYAEDGRRLGAEALVSIYPVEPTLRYRCEKFFFKRSAYVMALFGIAMLIAVGVTHRRKGA